jgi:two-component system response regulator MprA
MTGRFEIDRPPATTDVLVIDDDRLFRDVLADLLTSAGYRVTVAENGTVGLRRFADGHYHVIITDVRMPGPDGWEVARRVRAVSADVGIIVMSGGSLEPRDPAVNGNAGRLVTLPKPFPLEELIGLIDSLVRPSPGPGA